MELDLVNSLKPTTLIEEYILADKCKNGWLYQISARNGKFGIFLDGKFYLSRWKFKQNFIDGEIHWDLDNHYGTVKPLRRLEKIRGFKLPSDLGTVKYNNIKDKLNKLENHLRDLLNNARV